AAVAPASATLLPLYGLGAHGLLPSFPTRRSSDLGAVGAAQHAAAHEGQHRADQHDHDDDLDQAHAGLAGDGRGTEVSARESRGTDRKSTRLNSSHVKISYAVFCLKKKKHPNKGEP